VLAAVLVDDETGHGVGRGVAEELDLSVDWLEEEFGFGFCEEVDFRLLAEFAGEVTVLDGDDVIEFGSHLVGANVVDEDGGGDGDGFALGG